MQPLTVFDPPMCCSTGVCNPEVDPKLAQFAGDLDWLKNQGVKVERINLAQEPGRFVENAAVKAVLDRSGGDELPVIVVGNSLVASGRYPSRDELAAMVGVKTVLQATELTERLLGAGEPKAKSGSCCGENRAMQGKTSTDCR